MTMTPNRPDLKLCDHLLELHKRNKSTKEHILFTRLLDEGGLDSETAEEIIKSQILDPSEMEEVKLTKKFIENILQMMEEEKQ
jgi:hypothetical protein